MSSLLGVLLNGRGFYQGRKHPRPQDVCCKIGRPPPLFWLPLDNIDSLSVCDMHLIFLILIPFLSLHLHTGTWKEKRSLPGSVAWVCLLPADVKSSRLPPPLLSSSVRLGRLPVPRPGLFVHKSGGPLHYLTTPLHVLVVTGSIPQASSLVGERGDKRRE